MWASETPSEKLTSPYRLWPIRIRLARAIRTELHCFAAISRRELGKIFEGLVCRTLAACVLNTEATREVCSSVNRHGERRNILEDGMSMDPENKRSSAAGGNTIGSWPQRVSSGVTRTPLPYRVRSANYRRPCRRFALPMAGNLAPVDAYQKNDLPKVVSGEIIQL